MFEFLFHYSPSVFRKGEFVLLGRYPWWVLALAILAAALALGWATWRRRERMAGSLTGWRPAVVWLLQASLAALLLVLLWQPALRVSTLKPQQNIVAVVVDDSGSMGIQEDGQSRLARVVNTLNGGLVEGLSKNFQVRLYRLSDRLERIKDLDELAANRQATRIGDSLKEVVTEAGSLPIGAVVLLTDGADNSGGIDLETLSEIRSRRIPVHTIGFGRERFERDIEISDVQTPDRALADSRLLAHVTFRHSGYANQKARLAVRENGRMLASKEITLKAEGLQQSEAVLFNAGIAGAKHLQVSIDPLTGEENPNNNTVSRLVNVEAHKPRVLYMEGEPRWEYKFLRRAMLKDRNVQLVSILRTTQNKLYRQGLSGPEELAQGFPSRVEELFAYQGLVIGSVEASYFTASQQELIRQFVDRRGGGILFLGGRASLADGGYSASALAEIFPVSLPTQKTTFYRDQAAVELAAAGRDSLITRLVEETEENAKRWTALPRLADYQELGAPKAGATVLAQLRTPAGRTLPLLVTQNYGRGRAAVLATGGSWRWQMGQELTDQTHEMFWQQLLRWLVTGTPGPVTASTPRQVLSDETLVRLHATVRDKTYLPSADARVEARILGPAGISDVVELTPDAQEPGVYSAEWRAGATGAYMAELVAKRGEEEAGRDTITFRREDGVAENFRAEQNRELLEKLSEQTGGSYYRPRDARRLLEDITYSEAGITVRETKDLWNLPAVFLTLILLKALEWFLRRRWGVV
jgi:uncharacterized membrane protein